MATPRLDVVLPSRTGLGPCVCRQRLTIRTRGWINHPDLAFSSEKERLFRQRQYLSTAEGHAGAQPSASRLSRSTRTNRSCGVTRKSRVLSA